MSEEEMKDGEVFKMLGIVVGSLAAFFVLCIIIARIVSAPGDVGMSVDKMVEAATMDRIKPVGEVNIGKAPVKMAATAIDAKGTYQSACFACHGTGAAGAPKLGDKAAWKKRIAQGNDVLFSHAIKGFKGMPAKGGNASLSDLTIKAVVSYMVNNSQ